MRALLIAFSLIITLLDYAFSDVIHFKDGGTVEGIITGESEGIVIIDLGFGTMSSASRDIDYIEEATPEQAEKLNKLKLSHEIETGEWAPAGYEGIKAIYGKTINGKIALKEAERRSKAFKEDLAGREAKISELMNELDKTGQSLKAVDAKEDVEKYNKIVAQMNTLNNSLNKERNEINALYKREKALNRDLAKLADEYRSNFQLFSDSLQRQRSAVDEAEAEAGILQYFEKMSEKALEMEMDFERDTAEFTQEGGRILVRALIEDNVSAQFVVDTGASIVVITNDIAQKLGYKYGDISTKMEITMADGSLSEVKPVILKSVKVGNAEVKNVKAAILDSEEIGGTDGLLGMSFLSNFVIRVDSVANKLILERLLPN